MSQRRCYALPLVVLVLLFMVRPLRADAPPKAARSVHLDYPAPEADAFYNELTVRQSTPGSYFMAAGFTHGYFGMQEATNGQKWALFSVWDPAPPAGAKVAADDQVQVTYQADVVRVKRFGGEGTGGQCFFDFDWKVGETYRFLVKAHVENDAGKKTQRTSYAAWFFLPTTGVWKHLVTFKTVTHGERIGGLYSFVEDFRRDTKSATEIRRATFGDGWVEDVNGQWRPLLRARFTASGAAWEARDSIDAGLEGDPPTAFFLQTGGDTTTHTPLDSILQRSADAAEPPALPGD